MSSAVGYVEPSSFDAIDLHVLCLNGEECNLKLSRSTMGRDVYLMVSRKLPPKKCGKLTLCHNDSRLLPHKTLQEQGIVGAAMLSCTYAPTDLFAAWCYIKGYPVDEGELALEGVSEIEIENGSTTACEYIYNLPKSLKRLKFDCNRSLKGVTLPSSLHSLTFGDNFNQWLTRVTLPSNLQTLTFGPAFNQSLVKASLPRSLQNLAFGRNFNQTLQGVTLPSSLHSLTFGHSFNQILQGVTLPSSLQNLTLGWNFNQTLQGVTLPSSLQNLAFGYSFNQTGRSDLARQSS